MFLLRHISEEKITIQLEKNMMYALNEGKAGEYLEINLLGCSHIIAYETEEEEIEHFSWALREGNDRPHCATKFDAATALLLIINLLGDCNHSVGRFLLDFFVDNTKFN